MACAQTPAKQRPYPTPAPTPTPAPEWTRIVDEKTYHQLARSGSAISSTMLREFRRCPKQYHDIVTCRCQPASPDAYRLGRAAHKLILEGDNAFKSAFAVGGPLNHTTGRSYAAGSQTFRHWLQENGLHPHAVITPTESDTLARMRDAAHAHREIAALLAAGWAELSAAAQLEDLPCQARFDWLRPDGIVVDLKTTSDIARFEQDARRFGYLHQFAFYQTVAAAAGAGNLDMVAIVIEKKTPFRAGVWRFPAATLAPYAIQNQTTLRTLRRCREENRWPTGYEGMRAFPPAGVPPLWLN